MEDTEESLLDLSGDLWALISMLFLRLLLLLLLLLLLGLASGKVFDFAFLRGGEGKRLELKRRRGTGAKEVRPMEESVMLGLAGRGAAMAASGPERIDSAK